MIKIFSFIKCFFEGHDYNGKKLLLNGINEGPGSIILFYDVICGRCNKVLSSGIASDTFKLEETKHDN